MADTEVLPDATPVPVDDAAEVQALIDRKRPVRDGDCRFAHPIVCRTRGMAGAGQHLSRLHYAGPPRETGAVMVAAGSYGYSMREYAVDNVAQDKRGVGVSAGCDPDGPVGSMQSSGAAWSQVVSNGFSRCFQFGTDYYQNPDGTWEGGRCTSEMKLVNLIALQGDVGVWLGGWNTLNINFENLGLFKCKTGLECSQSGNVHVAGGSATEITGEIFRVRQGGVYSFGPYRGEGVNRLLTAGDTSACTQISMHDILLIGGKPAGAAWDGIDVLVRHGVSLTMQSCGLQGKIFYTSQPSDVPPLGLASVTLENVFTTGKVLLDGRPGTRCRFDIRNCGLIDPLSRKIIKRYSGKGILGVDPIPEET